MIPFARNVCARNIGWGLFGASAWVWCIGMYLPVLLLQWYGWSGFLIISIPNVIGAAAVGLLLGRGSTSRLFCQRHERTIRWFIVATIGFHMLFLAMVGRWLLPDSTNLPFQNVLLLPITAWMLAWMIALLPRQLWPVLGSIVWIGAVALLWSRMPDAYDGLGWTGTRPPINVLWYAPVFTFGLLLCPWLDGPFHRMMQASNSRWSFIVLGPAFGLMLFVTASYWRLEPDTLLLPVFVYLVVQCVFTMAANFRELSPGGVAGGRTGFILLLPLLVPLLPWLSAKLDVVSWVGALDAYLRYLVLYGMVFPAIVLYYCTPRPWPRSAGRTTCFIVLLLICAVLGEAGLINGHTWGHPSLAALAIGLLLAARWAWPGPRPVGV